MARIYPSHFRKYSFQAGLIYMALRMSRVPLCIKFAKMNEPYQGSLGYVRLSHVNIGSIRELSSLTLSFRSNKAQKILSNVNCQERGKINHLQ